MRLRAEFVARPALHPLSSSCAECGVNENIATAMQNEKERAKVAVMQRHFVKRTVHHTAFTYTRFALYLCCDDGAECARRRPSIRARYNLHRALCISGRPCTASANRVNEHLVVMAEDALRCFRSLSVEAFCKINSTIQNKSSRPHALLSTKLTASLCCRRQPLARCAFLRRTRRSSVWQHRVAFFYALHSPVNALNDRL